VTVWAVRDPQAQANQAQDPAVTQDLGDSQVIADPNPAPDLGDFQDDITNAQRIFTELGTGIDLEFTLKDFTAPFTQPVDLYRRATCDHAVELKTLDSRGYEADHINVYVVDALGNTAPGRNCYDENPSGSEPNIIFVGGVQYSWRTLAHELGHALGLVNAAPRAAGPLAGSYGPNAVYGHVDEMWLDPYLATDNLMYSGTHYIGQVTVGQIYRMHFDKLSWINKDFDVAAAGTNGYPRACQNSPVSGGPCPPLTLHPTRGWP
jgi:hypothetical protein